jgi:hypothetical protein
MLNINVTIFYCIFKIVTCFHEKDHVCDTHLPDDKMMITTEVNEWFFTKNIFRTATSTVTSNIFEFWVNTLKKNIVLMCGDDKR